MVCFAPFGVACRISGGHDLVAYTFRLRLVFGFLPLRVDSLILSYYSYFSTICYRLDSFFFLVSLPLFCPFQCIWVAGVRMLCVSYQGRRNGIALASLSTGLRCSRRLVFCIITYIGADNDELLRTPPLYPIVEVAKHRINEITPIRIIFYIHYI